MSEVGIQCFCAGSAEEYSAENEHPFRSGNNQCDGVIRIERFEY